MITAKKLKAMLERVPDEAKINAYEGEDIGFSIQMPDGLCHWIRARESDGEDDQPEWTLGYGPVEPQSTRNPRDDEIVEKMRGGSERDE